MQGTEYLQVKDGIYGVKEHWLEARNKAVELATFLHSSNVTKQLVNRIIEPFVWTTELVSGTEWENFFELRCPKYSVGNEVYRSKKDAINQEDDEINSRILSGFSELEWLQINESQAEIHIQKIAEMMWDEINLSVPKTLKEGQWHIPYGDNIDTEKLADTVGYKQSDYDWYNKEEWCKLYIATARAARISYTTLGGNPKIDYESDIKLHDRLLESKHLSCFEHCARAMSEEEFESFYKGEGANRGHVGLDENKGWCGNYRGFIQYRYLIENE